MATTYSKILIRRGSTLPETLPQGELFLLTTNNRLYTGNGSSQPTLVVADSISGDVFEQLTASIEELNKIDGFEGTVEDLNYAKDLRETEVTAAEFDHLDGVTAPIQTQLDNLETEIANVQGSVEWQFVNKITSSSTAISIDSTNLGESFNSSLYDYKFVLTLETNTEDLNIDSHILFNLTTTAGGYSYLYQHVGITGATSNQTVTTSEYGATSQNIPIIKTASDVSHSSSLPAVHTAQAEFVVTRGIMPNIFATGPGLIIEGSSTTGLLVSGPGAPISSLFSATSFMKFSGTTFQINNFSSIQIVSGFDAGTEDIMVIKVYKRLK